MNIIVDRKTWYRGNGSVMSSLLSNEGRCCLGFAAAQCGIPDEAVMNVDTPGRLARRNVGAASLFPANFYDGDLHHKFIGNADWLGKAMELNDDLSINDAQRETGLTKLFAENGHTITFEG